MKNKKRFLGLFLLYTKLCGDIGDASLSDLSDNFQVIIDPLNKAILSAQLSVPVKKIHKKLGDSFNKGDVLLELDSAIYVAQLKKARAVLEKAQNTYQAKEELFDARIASLSELKEAYALWATAQAELEVSKKQLEACKIVAPYRGKIANVLLFEHELPQVGQPLVEVVGDEVLLAKMLVDAKYLPQLSIDKSIEIYVNELKQYLTARIRRIGSVIDPASSTIAVEAEIVNTDSSLISGMTGFTLFSNEAASTQITLEEAKPQPSILEVPKKVRIIAKTILKNEGNFTEAIKSGNIPSKKPVAITSLKYGGNINSQVAERYKKDEPLQPINHQGHINSLLADYYYKIEDAPTVYIAFQSQIDQALSPYYSYNESKKVYEWLYFNGSINPPLAQKSINTAKEKPRIYVREGDLKDNIAFFAEQAPSDPLPYAGDINDTLALSSIEKSAAEANLYSAVQTAEELNLFEEQLKSNTAPLSYIPELKPRIKTDTIAYQGELNDNINKQEEAIAFRESTSEIDSDRLIHLDENVPPHETVEEQVEPLSFIPEIKIEQEAVAIQTLDEQVEPLSFVPELKIDETRLAERVLPPIQYKAPQTNVSILAIKTALENPNEYLSPSLIRKNEPIAVTEKTEEPTLEWQEALFGGGSGGKEIE